MGRIHTKEPHTTSTTTDTDPARETPNPTRANYAPQRRVLVCTMDEDSKTDLLAGASALLEDYKKQQQKIEEQRGCISKHMDVIGSEQTDLDKRKARLDKQKEAKLDQEREEARKLCQEPSSETSETVVVDVLTENLNDLDLQGLSEDVKVLSENPPVTCVVEKIP
ncbi:hypothetical protein DL768_005308 [Monosporascus sp. mg162]|nr:hypothetical protein DL768_005308 [Monosporascus sp. mg162]